jgi:hypothetical protein
LEESNEEEESLYTEDELVGQIFADVEAEKKKLKLMEFKSIGRYR